MCKNFFRFASLLSAVMLFAACDGAMEASEGTEGGASADSSLELSADKLIVSSLTEEADYVVFTAMFDGKPVTEGVSFYDKSGTPLTLDNFTFSTAKAGEYTFWANYKTFNSNLVTITAVPTVVPSTPVDDYPQRTDFNRKALMIKFTGQGCGACPAAIDAVHSFYETSDLASRAVIAEAHTFGATADPAELKGFYGVESFPTLVVDWVSYTSSVTKSGIERMLKDRLLDADGGFSLAKAGISVNSRYADGVLAFKVCVKAAETGQYRIGAWLLEDGIRGNQTGGTKDYHNIYDNCIRIADSKSTNTNYTGLKLGAVEAGKVAEKMFVWNFDEYKDDGYSWNNDWNPENMKLCVFVSAKGKLEDYTVNNVVIAPVNGELRYDYAQ